MQKFDFNKVFSQTARDYKIRAIQGELDAVGVQNVSISDCLMNSDRDGLLVMRTLMELHKQNRDMFYKLKVLKDHFGNAVLPGQKLEWKAGMKIRDPFGKKYTMQQINNFRRRGEIRQIEIWHSAIVDNKGCINVNFEDAAILLSLYGVYHTGSPITSMKETSTVTIDKYTQKPTKPTRYHWLYQEIPQDEYEQLPVLNKIKTDK